MLDKRNIQRTITGIGLLLIFVMVGCHVHDHHTTSPGHHHGHGHRTYVEDLEYPLNGADLSSIDASTINGSITVTGVSGSRGTIRIHKKVRAHTEWEARDFAHRVRIHREITGGLMRVYATYPQTPHGVSVEVSIDIECARDMFLALEAVNGRIEVFGTEGGVNAMTVNGRIEADVELTGRDGVFTSTNGSIEVRVVDCCAPITARTVNGAIGLELPRGSSGLLDAQTANGQISCAVPLSEIYVQTLRSLSGRFGSGGDTPVTLRTANGSIRVGQF